MPQAASAPGSSASSWSGSYTGQEGAGSTFVAIVVNNSEALAYVCDGDQVAQWFPGIVTADGRLALTSSEQWTLEATLDGANVMGHYTSAEGQKVAFTAGPASGDAGLYRTEFERGGVAYIGGWVVREDGEQRGSVIGGGTRRPTRNLAPKTHQATVEGFGTFATERVTPAYVDVVIKP